MATNSQQKNKARQTGKHKALTDKNANHMQYMEITGRRFNQNNFENQINLQDNLKKQRNTECIQQTGYAPHLEHTNN